MYTVSFINVHTSNLPIHHKESTILEKESARSLSPLGLQRRRKQKDRDLTLL